MTNDIELQEMERMGKEFDEYLESTLYKLDTEAVLTAKSRASLPDSAFCGPGRSFPVQNKAHYIAALAYLDRSKFSAATKAKIRSCIMSKGKKNGWAAQ